jgi:hypothetical protein
MDYIAMQCTVDRIVSTEEIDEIAVYYSARFDWPVADFIKEDQ